MTAERRASAVCVLAAFLVADPAMAQQVRFNVPEQSAITGIPAFALQAGVQIVSPVAQIGSQKTRAVRGAYAIEEALAILLRGTGLHVVLRSGNAFSLALDAKRRELPAKPLTAATRAVRPHIEQTHVDRRPPEDIVAQDIIVTGSHIGRPEVQSAMPIMTINMDTARGYGYETAYDALITNPAIGPGLGNYNSQGDTFDVGVANINLRNLGVNRSLVLVDGRRWVSGGARTSVVDLNTVPDAMIDRFEIVTGGAAAIYGADAVTGVVNIITKKSATGLRISTTNGISQQGDAPEASYTATTGFRFGGGRGSAVIGGTYNYAAPLRDTDRYTNRVGYIPNPANTGPHDGIADNILDDNIRYLSHAAAPTIFYHNQWYILQNGVLGPTGYNRVIVPGPLGSGDGGPALNSFENHFLRNKAVTASLAARLGYDVGPAIRWNANFAYAHSYTRAPTVFPEVRDDVRPTNWWGGTTGEVAALDTPFLPDALRQFMIANGLSAVPLNRTYLNLPEASEIHRRDNVTVGIDAGGKLTDRLKWTAFLQYGQVVDNVTTTNMIRHREWLNARDAIADPVTGQPECADASARVAGCVPFNFFTTDAPDQAFLHYVEADRYEQRKNTLANAGGNITGSILRLPYGDLSIAVGAEWRRETLSTRDDPNTAKLNDIVFSPGVDYVLHPALTATRDTSELYGELVIPVLENLPFARHLGIEGAYRFSHYTDEPDTNTWKIGSTWEPVSGVTLRGVYSHSVRVPNFGEVYSPLLIQTVGVTTDPCSGVFITQGPNRARNCAALLPGLSLPLAYPNTNAPTILLGGNPDLKPETSNSFTMGAVVQPTSLPGFDLTVDFWNIEIQNVITAIPYNSILNLCADSNSGIDNFYCNLITRNTVGQIITIRASNYNLALLKARGIDFGLSYHRHIGPGSLQLGFSGTYLLTQTNIGSPGTDAIDYAGQWNYPRLRGTLTTSYGVGKVTVGLITRFISRSVFDVTDASIETRDPNHVPAYLYNDLTVQFRLSRRYSLTLGVKNISNAGIFGPLQDTAPGPNSSGGVQTGAAYYDAIGRYFFAKIDLRL